MTASRRAARNSSDQCAAAAIWKARPSNVKIPPVGVSQRRRALARIVSNTASTLVGEPEITRKISLVAVCCSSAPLSARSRSACDPLSLERLRGVPHSPQYFWLEGFSCWHRGQCMLGALPTGRRRDRSDRCRELSLGGRRGQGRASHQNFGYRAGGRTSEVTVTHSEPREEPVTRPSLREYAAVQRERDRGGAAGRRHSGGYNGLSGDRAARPGPVVDCRDHESAQGDLPGSRRRACGDRAARAGQLPHCRAALARSSELASSLKIAWGLEERRRVPGTQLLRR